jgi:hypothetical protein
LSIFALNSFISLFIVIFVSVWCLFRSSMILFICFWVFSYSLFLLSWNFLSASYLFWLTMSSIISMKFSLITCRITSLGCSCGLHWVPWYSLSLFCWSLDRGIHFLHFALNPILLYFGGREWFPSLFLLPIFPRDTVSVPGLCVIWY